ncbi:MAG: hypothetical protein ACLP1Y_07395 [Candidatus Acidiferrales bacterium]
MDLFEDGTGFSMVGVQASDGVGLTIISGELETIGLANEHFDKELKRALRIYEHTVQKDRNGEIVGQRALVTFPLGGTQQPNDSVIWVLCTQGENFYEMGSTSFADTLALEKQYKQPSANFAPKPDKPH